MRIWQCQSWGITTRDRQSPYSWTYAYICTVLCKIQKRCTPRGSFANPSREVFSRVGLYNQSQGLSGLRRNKFQHSCAGNNSTSKTSNEHISVYFIFPFFLTKSLPGCRVHWIHTFRLSPRRPSQATPPYQHNCFCRASATMSFVS